MKRLLLSSYPESICGGKAEPVGLRCTGEPFPTEVLCSDCKSLALRLMSDFKYRNAVHEKIINIRKSIRKERGDAV
jgi:hypothetical protein